ncbi:MAG: hypothetical protein HPY71_15425 [Firmicutes bacterium]|nr:hypothetical protein [Bacillota bacterium]
MNLPATRIYRLPDDVAKWHEWMVEPVACVGVVNGLNFARALAGDYVALVGCGFMGLLLARAWREPWHQR